MYINTTGGLEEAVFGFGYDPEGFFTKGLDEAIIALTKEENVLSLAGENFSEP